MVNVTQERITGSVTLRLYKGNVTVAGRQSQHALYDERFVTFGEDDVYSQGDAGGFIRLFGLSNRVRALKDIEIKKDEASSGSSGSSPGSGASGVDGAGGAPASAGSAGSAVAADNADKPDDARKASPKLVPSA
jgi:hypothetical protein